MKQTILGKDRKAFDRRLKRRKAICIWVTVVTVALNLLLCLFRNETNHYVMLVLNIAIDLLVGWFLIAFVSLYVVPQLRLVKLYKKKSSAFVGELIEISEETVRVEGFDCYKLKVGAESRRVFFLPDSFEESLPIGAELHMSVVSGIVVEVRYEE